MAIILSNRLKAMQDAAENFGDSVVGIRAQQRKIAQEKAEEQRIAAQEQRAQEAHGVTMGRQKTAAGLEDIQFGQAKAQQAAGMEAQGLAAELEGFGQAVPESEISLPGFGGMQSPKPVMDDVGESLKDRIRASMHNAGLRAEGKNTGFVTAEDLKIQRATSREEKVRKDQEFSLGLDKTRADIESTKAGTADKEMGTKKTSMEIKKLQAELDAFGKGGMDPEKAIVAEGKLRDSYLGQTKGFTDVHDAYGRVMASVKDPSPAGDIALIFNYMKMLDPGSTVREGEFATAEQAGSIPTSILNKYNKAVSGERLGENRADFIKQAGNLYEAAHRNYSRTQKTFTDLATSYKLDPSRVAVNLENAGIGQQPAAGGATKISTKEEWAALPPGTSYIGPDGKKATKR